MWGAARMTVAFLSTVLPLSGKHSATVASTGLISRWHFIQHPCCHNLLPFFNVAHCTLNCVRVPKEHFIALILCTFTSSNYWSLVHLSVLELCVRVLTTLPLCTKCTEVLSGFLPIMELIRRWLESCWKRDEQLKSDSSSVLHVHSPFLPFSSTWLGLLESGVCVQKLLSAVWIAFGIPSNFPEGFSPIHHNSTREQMDVKEMQWPKL